MKVIGLIGGMSWESTAEYYRIINKTVKERLGGLHSAKILLYSVDFSEIETLQREGRWPEATKFMCDAAQRIERGGAECVLICTNTMHKMAPEGHRDQKEGNQANRAPGDQVHHGRGFLQGAPG
jgi:aspartate racemase